MHKVGFAIGLFLFVVVQLSAQPMSSTDTVGTIQRAVSFERELSWEQILVKAQKEKKLVFVDVVATWCGPCKMMDRDVYSNQKVADEIRGNFIAVKVQMDSTSRDDASTKSWYADAGRMTKKYEVTSLPSFLFFDAEGRLIDKGSGYRRVADFMSLLRQAQDFGMIPLRDELEAYKRGVKKYSIMNQLALFEKHVEGNKLLADSIARNYVSASLNKLPAEELCIKERLDFLDEFGDVISENDNIFKLCYDHPDSIDLIKGQKGWSLRLVERTITREELLNRFTKNEQSNRQNPDWKQVLDIISQRYAKVDSRLLVLQFQIWYYRVADLNWNKWAKYTNEKLKYYPPVANKGLAVFMTLNMSAWDAFLNCKDKNVLKEALQWSDLSIKLETNIQYLDTRANLLYKLGWVGKAVNQESAAINMSENIAKKGGIEKGPFIDEFLATRDKMLHNQPTWPLN